MTLPKTERDELFTRTRKIARKVSARFSKRVGIPYRELLAEAEYVLACKICTETYNHTLSKESTWAYIVCYWGLKEFCRQKAKEKAMKYLEDGLDPAAKKDYATTLLQNLGEEGRTLVNTIINAPAEIANDVYVFTKTRGKKAVCRCLLRKGWGESKIHKAWKEVEKCL